MKAFKPLLFLALLLMAGASAGDETSAQYDPGKEAVDIFVDLIVIRPISVVATLVGTGLFIGLSPFAGLATIAPPHDAIVRAGNAFVGLPACYAFNRPMGDLTGGEKAWRADGKPNYCTW